MKPSSAWLIHVDEGHCPHRRYKGDAGTADNATAAPLARPTLAPKRPGGERGSRCLSAVTDAIASDATVADNRLPARVVPHRYTLRPATRPGSNHLVGHVIIDATVNEAVTRIVLNADELDITDVKVGGEEATFELDATTERLVINSSPTTGTTTIEITFTGTLNDKLRGWYRSTYTDADGSEQVIAASQMQATDCRRAFPCFDEPDFKAVFDVTLIIEPHLMAISNGPEIERTTFHDGSGNDTGKVAVRFGETMPMSTYLVAFVVGNLEATEPVLVPRAGTIDDFIPLRIIHVPGKGHLTAFGLDIGARTQLVPALLRHPLPHRQVRHVGAARLRRRCDGEPRRHHLPREPAAGRSHHRHAGRIAEPG